MMQVKAACLLDLWVSEKGGLEASADSWQRSLAIEYQVVSQWATSVPAKEPYSAVVYFYLPRVLVLEKPLQ